MRLRCRVISPFGIRHKRAGTLNWTSDNRFAVNETTFQAMTRDGDRKELARIAEEEFGDAALDLVVDDCSHLYEPARQSFNELFPRLRAGGAYVIEDWRWGHIPLGQETPESVPEISLSRLIVEIVLASATLPGLASEMTVDLNGVSITRGDAPLSPAAFDVSSLVREDTSDLPSNTC